MTETEIKIEKTLGSAAFDKLSELRSKTADIDDLLSMEGLSADAVKSLNAKKAAYKAEGLKILRSEISKNGLFMCY